jgi:GNAT superfamily N-acetyltransferase
VAQRFADRAGARFVLVADDESDELIGFAAAGPERSGDPKYRGELYALYVLTSHQRRGLGRALVRAVAGRLAAGGTESMLLWVLEANVPARRFYETLGGAVVRDQPIEIGGVTCTEVAYGWPGLDVLLKAVGPQPSAGGLTS